MPAQKRLPVVLSPEDIRRLLHLIYNPRCRLCLALMYACGLRIGEASTLTVSQVDGTRGLLRIIGKGNKERLVPLPQPLLLKLRELWKTHHHPQWLFPNRRGTAPLASHNLRLAFRAAARAAGLPPTLVPHALRHSYATQLLHSGVELRIVQILLGHASLKSTTVYTHLTEPGRQRLHILLDDLMVGL
jgi:site-specific recombinase XerD